MTLVREVSETQVVRRLDASRVVAAAVFDTASQAADTGAALVRGGVGCLEIGFGIGAGTPAAIRAARQVDGLLVGAGNVLDPDQAARAHRAGAQFATAPGTNMAVVHACRELELPFFPGVATPSEIERLQSLGVIAMGIFPACTLGGPQFLEAIGGAYPGVGFIPSGGIRAEALRSYAAVPAVLAVTCHWIVRADHVRTHSFDRVERLAREAHAGAGRR